MRVPEGDVYDEVGPVDGNPPASGSSNSATERKSRRLFSAARARPLDNSADSSQKSAIKVKFTRLDSNEDSDMLGGRGRDALHSNDKHSKELVGFIIRKKMIKAYYFRVK